MTGVLGWCAVAVGLLAVLGGAIVGLMFVFVSSDIDGPVSWTGRLMAVGVALAVAVAGVCVLFIGSMAIRRSFGVDRS